MVCSRNLKLLDIQLTIKTLEGMRVQAPIHFEAGRGDSYNCRAVKEHYRKYYFLDRTISRHHSTLKSLRIFYPSKPSVITLQDSKQGPYNGAQRCPTCTSVEVT